MRVEERFLEYVRVDTQSCPGRAQIPSTECQWTLARRLARELQDLGLTDARVDDHCYVMATLPSNLPAGRQAPALGLIAHMDTAPETSGKNVCPRIVRGYDGGDIVLNEARGVVLSPREFESLSTHLGEDLIVTDGTTLLGADNKAGVAEIMTVAEYLVQHPEVPHGKLCIGFTPDEEVGHGANAFDIAAFGADLAYTVDGGELGEIEYENFNAAAAHIVIHGRTIHPGYAKNKMKNAVVIGGELLALLPAAEQPAHTEGYEGFYHASAFSGTVEQAELQIIIREHDAQRFLRRKEYLTGAVALLNRQYGPGTVEMDLQDSYYNMREKILPHMELVEHARTAMEAEGIRPLIVPVRGGTDGARLSYMGLPCPNLCAGAHNTHGIYEYCSIQSMEKIVAFLLRLVQQFGGAVNG